MPKAAESIRPSVAPQRAIDRAIAQASVMLNFLKLAKAGNYPPATTAQLWQAVHAHSQIKFHIDAEVSAQTSAWARANRPDHVVPAAGKVTVPAAIEDCKKEDTGSVVDQGGGEDISNPPTIQVGIHKIPIEAC